MKVNGIVFDLDGTLVDSLKDIVWAVNASRGAWGLLPLESEYIRKYIGKGAEYLMVNCFPPQIAEVTTLVATYRKIASTMADAYGSAYPSVRETLGSFRAKGWKIGVATNKMTQWAMKTLDFYLPGVPIDVINGPEKVSRIKPSPAHLLETIAVMGISPQSAWYVGDDPVDQACAKAAGVRFIAAGWGFGGVQPDPGVPKPLHFSEILDICGLNAV